jgi:hypothetical protein
MTQATRVHSTPSLNTPSSVPIICAEDQMRAAIRGWLHCSPDRRPSVRALGAHTRKTIEIDYSISQKEEGASRGSALSYRKHKRSGLRLEDESSTDKPATHQQLAALEFEPWSEKPVIATSRFVRSSIVIVWPSARSRPCGGRSIILLQQNHQDRKAEPR